jgi:hypothetical protein
LPFLKSIVTRNVPDVRAELRNQRMHGISGGGISQSTPSSPIRPYGYSPYHEYLNHIGSGNFAGIYGSTPSPHKQKAAGLYSNNKYFIPTSASKYPTPSYGR